MSCSEPLGCSGPPPVTLKVSACAEPLRTLSQVREQQADLGSRSPHRERIVHVSHYPDEGGMNLINFFRTLTSSPVARRFCAAAFR